MPRPISNRTLPKTRIEYWHQKILVNVETDSVNLKKLKKLGWKPFVFWECELSQAKTEATMNKLIEKLTKRLNEIY